MRADPPAQLADPGQYLLADVYGPAPRRLTQWEEGQLSQLVNASIGIGGDGGGGLISLERGALNLPLASWLLLHADLRNDRDRDGRVTRAVADLLVRVGPGLWLGASGVPAASKEDYGVGASALWIGARGRYLLARVVADQFLYDRTNLAGGKRATPVLHAQAEGRWEDGPWSFAGSIDAQTDSETTFRGAPALTYQLTSRRELSLHARYAIPEVELDARVEVARLRDARTELEIGSGLRQTLTTARIDALLPPLAGTRWRPRLELRAQLVEARGDEGSAAYRATRREPGGRLAAQREDGAALLELGYALAVPDLSRTGDGPELRLAPYQDAAYGSLEVSFGPRIHLRGLLAWQVRNGGLTGNGAALLQF